MTYPSCPGCGEESAWSPDYCPECFDKQIEELDRYVTAQTRPRRVKARRLGQKNNTPATE